ncbi:MAG: O-antigen ligase family protein [Oscillospiraceae bacterium]|nr:O-antigen ligase family protein [Oscillospiraceae bacterium]
MLKSDAFFALSSSGPLRRIRENETVSKINGFMRTPAYVIILAALTVLCNLLSLDLYIYSIFIAVGVFIALFGIDFLPLMPIVILCYIAPSPSNNPGSADNKGSIFYFENGGLYLIILISLLVLALIFRLLTDKEIGGRAFLTKNRKLLSGMLILGASYLLSGIGMSQYGSASWRTLLFGLAVLVLVYVLNVANKLLSNSQLKLKECVFDKKVLTIGFGCLLVVYALAGALFGQFGNLPSKNLLFSLIQCVAVMGMYFLFSGTVKWSETPKYYLAWVGTCAGLVVLPQLLENYVSGRVFMEGTGTMDRELIFAGWGMHNNIGGMMAFMLPFPFYLAMTRKRSWIYNILGTVLMLGVVLSCSRTSMLVAAVVYCLCAVMLLRRKEERKANLLVYGIIAGIVVLFCVIFFKKLMEIFALFFEELFIMSERDNLVGFGFKQYQQHPIFGGSFFPQGEYVPWDWSTSEAFSSFFPPRWHNTIIQMLASCGIVGLVCYLVHRYQTVKLLVINRSIEKRFILLFMISLTVCSLMDCHFFNVGPVLFYSMALAFAENIAQSKVIE